MKAKKEDGKGGTENMRFVDQNYAMSDWMRREQEKAAANDPGPKSSELGDPENEPGENAEAKSSSNSSPFVSFVIGVAAAAACLCIGAGFAWNRNQRDMSSSTTATVQSTATSAVHPPIVQSTVKSSTTTPLTNEPFDRFSIVVYTEPWCGPCKKLKAALLERNLPFIELSASDPSYARGVRVTGGGAVVPITRVGKVYRHELRETWIVGNKPDAIETAALVGNGNEWNSEDTIPKMEWPKAPEVLKTKKMPPPSATPSPAPEPTPPTEDPVPKSTTPEPAPEPEAPDGGLPSPPSTTGEGS